MAQGTRVSRLIAAIGCLAMVVLAAACGSHPQALVAKPGPREFRSQPAPSSGGASPSGASPSGASPSGASASGSSAPGQAADAGTAGTYQVSERQLTFTEPAGMGAAGYELGPRTLIVDVRYPRTRGSADAEPARGPFPLIMFAPGFMKCDGPYGDLLSSWAGAGYVVAAVNFPRTDCYVGDAAYEPDLVNQPRDVSYVLSRLLALSRQPHGLISGLLDSRRIAAAGQSDGGDTVAALAANTCCTDHRLTAVAVLSGAEWAKMPGHYFPGGAPPMLFVQGSADDINPPWTSMQMYNADWTGARYYLDLFGASHLVPYEGTNKVERIVAATTLAFFDRYVLDEDDALATLTQDGNVRGAAELVSGGDLPTSITGPA